MGKIRLLVLDVLKPHEPTILNLSRELSKISGVDGVDITVYEIDSKVENVKITIQGPDIHYEKIEEKIEEFGGSIHSIDKVASGKKMISEVSTHQDAYN